MHDAEDRLSASQGVGNVFDRYFDGYITGTHSSLSPVQQGPAPTWASLLMLPMLTTWRRSRKSPRKRSLRAWASAAVVGLAGVVGLAPQVRHLRYTSC